MKVLHLTLKKKWFDMIASGEKEEEYRELKEYWIKRFCTKEWYKYEAEFLHKAIDKYYDVVVFRHGYSKNAPMITVECKGISIGEGRHEWGANRECFIIHLGDILSSTGHPSPLTEKSIS